MWTTDTLGRFPCYTGGMKTVATVEMIVTDKDLPGVRIQATEEFLDMEPIERVSLLIAAVKLCGAAISAVVADNPEYESEIWEYLDVATLHPDDQALN